METRQELIAPTTEVSTFQRVLVGVDDSPESLEAARQAATLAEGPITLVSAYDLTAGLVGGTGPSVPAYLDEDRVREEAEAVIDRAREEIGDKPVVAGRVDRGRPWELLLAEIARWDDTLVAVGSHGHGRALGILIGSTATELIHKAPCSVLVTRTGLGRFPQRVVAGLDGSPESLLAYETAKSVAERFDAELDPVVAHVNGEVDVEAIERVVGEGVRRIIDEPVSALVSLSADADLVVVGSRGLRGVKALGSVSERVAHQAASSVLIVRRRP